MDKHDASEVIEAAGHLIDSGILNGIFDTVVRHGASFEVLRFTIGRTNEEPSLLTMRVNARSDAVLRDLVEDLVPLGCQLARVQDASTRPTDRDGCAPTDFYSTTNHETHIRRHGQWMTVEGQRMDAAIVIEGSRVVCRKLRVLTWTWAISCLILAATLGSSSQKATARS